MTTTDAQSRGLRVLVTGGARGIGAAIVDRFLDEGAEVASIDRGFASADPADRPRANLHSIIADVASSASLADAFTSVTRDLGGIDVLVNNAGIAETRKLFEEMHESEWSRVIDVNIGGTLRCIQAALPSLKRSSRASIVNISSTWALGGVPGFAAYSLSKAALVGLTRTLASEFGPLGIRVNAVCPGYVDNDMGRVVAQMQATQATAAWVERDRQARLQPLGRQCTPKEVADVVSFLSSTAASYMTGTALPVDGGQSSRLNTGEERTTL